MLDNPLYAHVGAASLNQTVLSTALPTIVGEPKRFAARQQSGPKLCWRPNCCRSERAL